MATELKLLIAPADVAHFRRLALLRQFAAAKPRTRPLRCIYFDTPERHLAQRGMALWLRRAGAVTIQTLEAGGEATAELESRHEWTTRVAGARPEPGELIALLGARSEWRKSLRALKLARALVPVFDTEVQRSVWSLRLQQRAEIELALDQGELRSGTALEPISAIELELKTGDPGALFDLALQLQAEVPLRLGSVGTAARGHALLAPHWPVAVKARRVELDSDLTVEQGFRVVFANCLSQMQHNEPGVLRGTDPESIHQMRVGMRRLRSALRLFARWCPPPQHLRDELGWLGAELAAARDADVLATATLPKVAETCGQEAGLAPLRRLACLAARAKRQQAAAAVGSVRYSRLMLGLLGWVQASRWQESADDALRRALAEPLRKPATQILARLRARLLDSGERLAHGTPEERHRVRIAAKRARYATEFFQSLHGAPHVQRCVQRLAALESALGWLNDATVADRLLRELEREHPGVAGGASFARGYLRGATTHDLRGLGKRWRRASALASR